MRNKSNHITGKKDTYVSARLGMFSWRKWHLPTILKDRLIQKMGDKNSKWSKNMGKVMEEEYTTNMQGKGIDYAGEGWGFKKIHIRLREW